MALTKNDALQKRGLIKIWGVDEDGNEFAIKFSKTGELIIGLPDAAKGLLGDKQFLYTRDINELFSEILDQLKIIVAQNNEVHDLNMNKTDIRRD